jgi:hypothetical protein
VEKLPSFRREDDLAGHSLNFSRSGASVVRMSPALQAIGTMRGRCGRCAASLAARPRPIAARTKAGPAVAEPPRA